MGQPISRNLRSIPKFLAEDLFNPVWINYVEGWIVMVEIGKVEHNELVEKAR